MVRLAHGPYNGAMSRILAIETCTEACSAAVWSNGDLIEESLLEPRVHAARLLSLIDTVLARADFKVNQLDAIAVGRGPGSFTGVRIGIATAQGLALGADLPVTPVSSLRALAWASGQHFQRATVCAAFDARMGEVYVGGYRLNPDGGISELLAEQVVAPDQVSFVHADSLGVGSGFGQYTRELTEGNRFAQIESTQYPSARAVASLAARGEAQSVLPEHLQANYLRDRVTQ